MKKTFMRTISTILCISLLTALISPAFAANDSKEQDHIWTYEEIIAGMEDGSIEWTFEERELSDFTDEEIAADEGLQQLVLDVAALTEPCDMTGTRTQHVIGKIYTLTAYVDASTPLKCYSIPYAEITFQDVIGSVDVNTRMYVYEYVTFSGQRDDSWNNIITYSNISVAFGCGENTRFSRDPVVSVNTMRGSGLNVNFAGIFGIAANAVGYSTVAAILNAISYIQWNTSNSTTISMSQKPDARIIGVKWGHSLDLIENDAYVKVETGASVYNTSLKKDVSTSAVAQWTFNVYNGTQHISTLATNVTLTPTVTYLANRS